MSTCEQDVLSINLVIQHFTMQKYWELHYYQTADKANLGPSAFALFVEKFDFKTKIETVVDVGCGSGRDSYFLGNKHRVTAIDNASTLTSSDSVTFKYGSMENLDGKYDLLYSRFSLHSVPVDVEVAVLSYAIDNCRFVAFEARSVNDTLCSNANDKNECWASTSYAKEHYRRFINLNAFCDKLRKLDFTILHASESDEYAVYKDDKPFCIRVIASTRGSERL